MHVKYQSINFSDGTSSINGAATNASSVTDYVAMIGGDPCPLSGDFLNGYDIQGGQSMLTFTFNTPVDLRVDNFIYLDYYYFNDVQNNSDLSRYLAVQDIVLITSAGNLTGSATFTNATDVALNNQEWVKFRVEVPYTASNTLTVTGIRVDIEMNNGGTGATFNTASSEVFALALEGIGGSDPLPVELMHFNTELEGKNAASLNWATASELNNAGYEIEHALPTTGLPVFEQIDYVDGAGTTTQVQYYNYKVPNLVAGVHYFRLKQVDFDGTYAYTDIRALRVDAPLVQKLFPTVLRAGRNTMYIQLAKDDRYKIEILTTLGSVVERHDIKAKTNTYYELELDRNHCATGVYVVYVRNNTGSYSQKIRIE
ncbi:T9SS type A sorting domain-containing protein [Aureispira anguillae]|nr:T9SS type A sorting domain-containing protein [Aureispira anguillae]